MKWWNMSPHRGLNHGEAANNFDRGHSQKTVSNCVGEYYFPLASINDPFAATVSFAVRPEKN